MSHTLFFKEGGTRKLLTSGYLPGYLPGTYSEKSTMIEELLQQEEGKISDRAARVRLKKMVEEGLVAEISTHAFDPQKKFILK